MRHTVAAPILIVVTLTSVTNFAAALLLTTAAVGSTAAPDGTELPYSLGPWLDATASAATINVLEDALQKLDVGVNPDMDVHLDASGSAALWRAHHQQQQQQQPHICIEHVAAIEQQIVDGINFRFHVTGCALPLYDSNSDTTSQTVVPPSLLHSGRCVQACGTQQEAFCVTVFCRPWTHTTQVLSIVRDNAVTQTLATAAAAYTEAAVMV